MPLAVVARALAAKARPRLRPRVDLRPAVQVRAAHAASRCRCSWGPSCSTPSPRCVDLGPTSGDPADVLLELLDAHLVQLGPGAATESHGSWSPSRSRGFARRRLAESPLDEATRDRHATYFLNRARAGGEVVRRAWPDIAAALDHELDHGRFDDALASAIALAPGAPGDARRGRLAAGPDRRAAGQGRRGPRPAARAGADVVHQHLLRTASRRTCSASGCGPPSGSPRRRPWPASPVTARPSWRCWRRRSGRCASPWTSPSAVSAAHEGLELAGRLDDQRALSRFECYVSMAARSTGDVERAVRLATSAIERGRTYDDPVAVTSAAQLLLALPRGAAAEPRPSASDARGAARAVRADPTAVRRHDGAGDSRAGEPGPERPRRLRPTGCGGC